MTTINVPSHEGLLSPEEAEAFRHALLVDTNFATDTDKSERGLKLVQSVVTEWSERMRPLHRRWRGTLKMLSGNTLENGGPEDVHVPALYQAIETIVPRVEEQILEKEPWFKIIPRKQTDRAQAETLAAYIDWQFDQARVRNSVQSAIRDMIVTQKFVFYVYWDNRENFRNVREVERSFDKNGMLKRKVKVTRKKVIDYSGCVAKPVDPFDFIIDTKSTNPQDAGYCGHRAWMTIEEIKRIGKQMGWMNLDQLDETNSGSSFGNEQDFYSYPRDPASRYGSERNRPQPKDGRPEKLEVVFLYSRWDLHGDGEYTDVRFVVSGGKVVHEIRVNPNDGHYRPYATGRVTKSGHEFYGIGPFDNAVRLNQHMDRYQQITMRGSALAGMPFGFAEEDSELPDSLYKMAPGKMFKGVGNVKFSQIPDGFLRSMPLILSMWQSNIDKTIGVYPINQGQDTGGTATEASLSLQEGNRRMRGIIRAVGDGLEQLLELFYRETLQNSSEDVEFPVLGKRALDMRKSHLRVGPADLLDSVKFDLVGLRSLRTYGLKATGLQAALNSTMPLIASNPNQIDQNAIVYEFFSELVGPDEAARFVKIPTPIENLRSQEEENEGLITGAEIEVDPDDDHEEHMRAMHFLWVRATDTSDEMPKHVRMQIVQHWLQHDLLRRQKMAQEKAMEARRPKMQDGLPPEAGGQQSPETGRSSPKAGGMSDAMTQLANEPGGQTPMENPGPADQKKYSKSGRASRTTNQTENSL